MSTREKLKSLYRSERWQKKVDAMSDKQVVAIYLKFERDGRFK